MVPQHDKCFNCDKDYVYISTNTSFIMERKPCVFHHMVLRLTQSPSAGATAEADDKA
jgi:hypothetical protein